MSDRSGTITALDDRTIREIAAGEVVERPASVVKELLENALDANADRVAVAVENGGIDGIRIRDTGHGIPPAELPKAVAEHATSKLSGGLNQIVNLGFRGEALYAIGSVARLTLRSRPPDRDTGAAITVTHGARGEVQRVGCPVGTTVEVSELFAETPARRKFLAEPTTEFDHVNRVVSAYALANPDTRISLEHDGRELFATPGDGRVRSAALAVYGRAVAESLLDVGDVSVVDSASEKGASAESVSAENASAGGATDEGDVRVGGVVSEPETTRASREYVTTFVNGRWVRDSALRSAVIDAYQGQLAADRYPFAVVFVTVPPDAVDANVHPRKTEVRFDDDARVYETVREVVREGLLDAGVVRASAPRGRSAPDETTLDPEVVGGAGTAHERAAADRRPDDVDGASSGRVEAGGESAADGESVSDDESVVDGETADETESSVTSEVLDAWGDVTDDSGSASSETAGESGEETNASGSVVSGSESAATESASGETAASDEGSEEPHAGQRPTPRGWQADSEEGVTVPTQTTLDGDQPAPPETESLPDLRVLGQYDDTYLVCETDDGLVLIDQHAADERVNYERLQAAADDGLAQELVDPVAVSVTAREAALFDRLEAGLAAAGFEAERRDDHTLAVTRVPAVFDAALDPELLRDALTAAAEGVAADDPVAATADALLADLACYPSITGHTSLTEGTARELLGALDACENPYACPHGRPVLVRFGADEVRDRFERDYPGHGHD